MTGTRRGQERDELVKTPTYRAFTYTDGKRDLPPDGRTRFLVCTAAGEVGADLDADAAVMDLVPLERMIQRIGRVNRRGELGFSALVTVLDFHSTPENAKDKALTARLAATRTALEALPALPEGGYDASPFRIGAISPDLRRRASTPAPPVPTIEREHVEAWALTSLADHPGRPDVEPFLRGEVEEEPQTTVAWRTDVAHLAELPGRTVEQAMAAARLMPAEVLEAPSREFTDILQKRIKSLRKEWEKTATDEVAASPAPLRLLQLRGGKLIARGTITVDWAVLEPVRVGEPSSWRRRDSRMRSPIQLRC